MDQDLSNVIVAERLRNASQFQASAHAPLQIMFAQRQCAGMRHTVVIAILALMGCSSSVTVPGSGGPPPSGSFPTGIENTCDGERYGTLVGQNATVLEKVMILGQVRVVRPGSVVTQDYRPERMNFNVGPNGQIASITCG